MIDKLSKELEQTDPYYVNRLMTKGVIRDISSAFVQCSSDISLRYFTTSNFRRSCSSLHSKFTRHSLRLNCFFFEKMFEIMGV